MINVPYHLYRIIKENTILNTILSQIRRILNDNDATEADHDDSVQARYRAFEMLMKLLE